MRKALDALSVSLDFSQSAPHYTVVSLYLPLTLLVLLGMQSHAHNQFGLLVPELSNVLALLAFFCLASG